MTFYLSLEHVTVGDQYRRNGQLRTITSLFVLRNGWLQITYSAGSLCGCDVFKSGEVVEVEQRFETEVETG